MVRWTSAILRTSKTIVLGLLVLVTVWFMYRMVSRLTRSLLGSFGSTNKQAEGGPIDFAESDVVSWVPKPGSVHDLQSDRTLDAILAGAFGPAVVMVYAEWCSHCKNMMDAYEGAAKISKVPFVRIQGSDCPISARKHQVLGYPTVFGVPTVGGLRKFGSARTIENLSQFAMALGPAEPFVEAPTVPVAAVPAVTIETIPPTVEVIDNSVAPLSAN